jgi:hypothetical protein
LKSSWLCVDGDLDESQFRSEAAALRATTGNAYDLNRYFCRQDELLRAGGKTYALTKGWVKEKLPLLKDLIDQSGKANIHFEEH